MKIQAIKKLCMKAETFYLFNCKNRRQFLSNGSGCWPVEGIQLEAAMIPALFDISDKQQSMIAIRELPVPDEERFTLEPMQGEEELEDMGLILHDGGLIRALRGEDGLLLIDSDLTKPGANKEGKFVYRARKREGRTPLVACYGDMLVSAIVMPIKGRAIMERLEKISYIPLDVFWEEDEPCASNEESR